MAVYSDLKEKAILITGAANGIGAAMTEAKKAVSSVTAAIVGIGLPTTPVEKAQVQVLPPLTLAGFVWTSTFESVPGVYFIFVDFHVFDTSSDYGVDAVWPGGIDVYYVFKNSP